MQQKLIHGMSTSTQAIILANDDLNLSHHMVTKPQWILRDPFHTDEDDG